MRQFSCGSTFNSKTGDRSKVKATLLERRCDRLVESVAIHPFGLKKKVFTNLFEINSFESFELHMETISFILDPGSVKLCFH